MVSIDKDRFWKCVQKSEGCWLWTASTTSHGYGQQMHSRQALLGHRIAWMLTHGPIPKGQCVCHRCDVPQCCRPDHLFLGTKRENLRDMQRKGRNYKPPKGSWSGELNVRAKLTADDVRAIRREYVEGLSLRVLGRKYGVAHTAIRSILNRVNWAHIR